MTDYETLLPMVSRIAQAVSSDFPPYITSDDTAQAIWIWVAENENTVSGLIRHDESWERKLYPTMTKVAYASAQKEEADTNGYSVDDVYHYNTKTIKALLERAFDYEDWQSFSTFGDAQPKGKRMHATGDLVDMLIDVKSATEKLKEDYYNLILWVYKYGHSIEWVAEGLGVSTDAIYQRHRRALRAIQKLLGRKTSAEMREDASRAYRPGRAEAQAVSSRNYDG